MKLIIRNLLLLNLILPSAAFAGFFGNSQPDRVCDDKTLLVQTYDQGPYPLGNVILTRMKPDFYNLGVERIPVFEDMYETARKENRPAHDPRKKPRVVFHKESSIPCAVAIAQTIRSIYLEKYQIDIGEVEVERLSPRIRPFARNIEIWWPKTHAHSFEP